MLTQDSVFDWNSMTSLNTKEGIISEETFEQVATFVSDTLSRRRRVSTDKKEQPTTHRRRASCTREERGQLYGLYINKLQLVITIQTDQTDLIWRQD